MAKKDDKKDDKVATIKDTTEAPLEGDLQDGSQVFMPGSGGTGVGSNVQVRTAPMVIESGMRRDDTVILGKAPKSFKAEGRPVDAIESAEVGDINALGVAVTNFIPTTPEGQFFKQAVLKILQHLAG